MKYRPGPGISPLSRPDRLRKLDARLARMMVYRGHHGRATTASGQIATALAHTDPAIATRLYTERKSIR